MKINTLTLKIFPLFLLLASGSLLAENSAFQSGINAFQDGDFATACNNFNLAYRDGIRKGSLLYNLGVCNFKQGRYSESKRWFTQVEKIDSLAQVAHYNLGLIADREGDRIAAKRWFKLAQRGANSTIAALADRQLQPPTKKSKPRPAGFVMFNAAYGYDDNIIDPAATAATDAGDNYLSLFVVASQRLDNNIEDGWSVKGSIFRTDYLSVNAYDMLNVKGGITRAISNRAWPIKLSLDYGQTTLNGASYLSKTALTVKSQNRTLNSGMLELRYRFNRIGATNTAYNHLAGNQQQIRVENRWQGAQQKQLRLGYDYENNSRNDLYTGAVLTSSYSPTRHTFNLRGRSELAGEWLGKARLSYRISHYPVDSNPQKRRDTTATIGFSAERPLWHKWDFSAGLKHVKNSSNIVSNSYNRNDLSLQLTRAF